MSDDTVPRVPATPASNQAHLTEGAGAAAAAAHAPNTEAAAARQLVVPDDTQQPSPLAPPEVSKMSPARRARRSPSTALESRNSTPSPYSEIHDPSDTDFVESSGDSDSDSDSSSAQRPLVVRRMAQPKPAAKPANAAVGAAAADNAPEVEGAAAPADDVPLAPPPAPKAAAKPAPKARAPRAKAGQRRRAARQTATRFNYDLTNEPLFMRVAFASHPPNTTAHTCGAEIDAGRALHAFATGKIGFGWRTVLSCKTVVLKLAAGNAGMCEVEQANGKIWFVPGHWVRVEMSPAEIAAARAAAAPAAH